MIQQAPESDLFKQEMRQSLASETKNSIAIKTDKHNNVYTAGDERETVYFIETGQVKLVMISSEGKECMLAIHGSGDIFGELCLSGLGGRLETATAMEDTCLKEIPCGKFLERLTTDSLLQGFVKYLAVRVADQQQVIANLVTVDSEHRLGETLLQLARKFGKKDPRSIRIELKDFSRRISDNGRHDAAAHQRIYAEIPKPWPTRVQPGSLYDHQGKEAHCVPRFYCLDLWLTHWSGQS